jgi:hypothetical protein
MSLGVVRGGRGACCVLREDEARALNYEFSTLNWPGDGVIPRSDTGRN